MQTFESKIINTKEIAKNTISIETEKPTDFSFNAGQFLQFIVPTAEKEVLRSYSIASSPNDGTLLFCVKLIKDGIASEYLRNLKSGDIIKMKGAIGRFSEEESGNSLFFVATGTGLAPTMSIIKDQLKNKGNKNKIHLLLGFRSENNIIWQEEIENLEKGYSNFTYMLTLSQPSENWSGMQGRVTLYFNHPSSSYKYFMCGNQAMVSEIRQTLIKNNIENSQIHFEIF
ncbi:MAG: FAD-dependent oxidoreductase [Candidatus Magasanikbacteria bacterium]|nr:FAD-dependent oxidoreductase [Candidatus Magasanikbacteria bacterium]